MREPSSQTAGIPNFSNEKEQRKAATVAGWMYLLTIVSANFSQFYVRGHLLARGDAVQSARNILASEHLFRIGIASDLITFSGGIVLVAALYAVLSPASRCAALVAAFWGLAECSVDAVITAINFAVLLSVRPQLFGSEQLQASARWFVSVDTAGDRVAGVVFGLGSTLFCYLWFKSRYIPRVLAAWGILSSVLPIVAQLAGIVMPSLADVPLRTARSGIPILSFEVMIGVWLLLKGIRVPIAE